MIVQKNACMILWEILDAVLNVLNVLDWLWHWRFGVCFWGGLVLAVLVDLGFHGTKPGHVLAAIPVIAGIVIGLRWDRSH